MTACKKAPSPSVSPEPAGKAEPEQVSPSQAQRQRLEWNLKTLTGAYESVGKTNAAWDGFANSALNEFARGRARIRDLGEVWEYIIATNCNLAISAGCDDPMIRYLFARFPPGPTNPEPKARVEAFLEAATDLEQSGYPALRKFYASFMTTSQIHEVYGYTNIPPRLQAFLSGNHIGAELAAALEDKAMPAEEAYEASSELLARLVGDKERYATWYQPAERLLFENWPQASTTWLLKGEAYVEMAWQARGGGYANSVSQEGWKLFGERLAVAQEALEKAWQLNPHDHRIPTLMIRVEEGQGKGRERMELWFSRAMALNPNNEQACKYKLHYLYPQWYGSREAMIAFGRECVASTNWGGNVPLILCEAHWDYAALVKSEAERADYWKRPDVWPDIRSAFERFFQLNPGAISWRHQYAWYAYRCEQWAELNSQLTMLGYTNYEYFGGRTEFDKMARLAKEHASAAKRNGSKGSS
ncbi:MAG TPA: hypothetical protein VNZ64_08630 [Candidatus Acidoferrum sp.]|nr:hypothetical protein [Candidatus Acidoferrum sp.]